MCWTLLSHGNNARVTPLKGALKGGFRRFISSVIGKDQGREVLESLIGLGFLFFLLNSVISIHKK